MIAFFTAIEKTSLESKTLNNKSITMLLEIILHFFGQKWYPSVRDLLTEQILYNLFNQNMLTIKNFVEAVHQQ